MSSKSSYFRLYYVKRKHNYMKKKNNFFLFFFYLFGKIRYGIGKKGDYFRCEWGRNSAPIDGQKNSLHACNCYISV